MTPNAVRLHRRAQKDIQDITDKATLQLVEEALDQLSTDAHPWRTHDFGQLAGRKNTYRIRVGDRRIIYVIRAPGDILVLRIATRGEAYKGMD